VHASTSMWGRGSRSAGRKKSSTSRGGKRRASEVGLLEIDVIACGGGDRSSDDRFTAVALTPPTTVARVGRVTALDGDDNHVDVAIRGSASELVAVVADVDGKDRERLGLPTAPALATATAIVFARC